MMNLPSLSGLLEQLKSAAAAAGGMDAAAVTKYLVDATKVAENLYKAGEAAPSKVVALYSSVIEFDGGAKAYSGNIAKDMAARGSGIVALDVTKLGYAVLELDKAVRAGAGSPLLLELAGGDPA